MKSLIIIANPSKTSFTHAVANSYIAGAKEAGKEVEVLDLYDIDQPFLRFVDTAALKKWEMLNGDKEKTLIQEKIARCDEMVYVFPVRRAGMPAILKNFFDVNLSSWFAFTFKWDTKKQVKLLTDKTAKIFVHCDAPAFLYKISFLSGIHIKHRISRMILWRCGVRTTQYKLFGKLRSSSTQQKESYLASIHTSGSKA